MSASVLAYSKVFLATSTLLYKEYRYFTTVLWFNIYLLYFVGDIHTHIPFKLTFSTLHYLLHFLELPLHFVNFVPSLLAPRQTLLRILILVVDVIAAE